jgi:hypothetical protein
LDIFLEGRSTLRDDEPVGPLEIARENLEAFADSLITQDSLRRMVDWLLVLKDVIKDDSLNELEHQQTLEEIKLIESAWGVLADAFFEKGISA